MFVAFLESVKYVGHLLPLSFLRVYMGYYYFNEGLIKFHGDYLSRPHLAAMISEWLPNSEAPFWYKDFLQEIIVPQWQIFAYLIMSCEFLIGVSFIVGYFVRPFAIVGMVMCLNFIMFGGPQQETLFKTFFAIHLTMGWLGAGRCLGFDYFFYKRNRGIWW